MKEEKKDIFEDVLQIFKFIKEKKLGHKDMIELIRVLTLSLNIKNEIHLLDIEDEDNEGK